MLDVDKEIVRFRLNKPLQADPPDRRAAFRYTTNMSVLALLLNKGKEKKLPNAVLRNISLTGAGIDSGFNMPIGETVSLHFYLPENGQPFYAVGKVVWSDSLGHCGVQFQQISAQHFSSLQSWLTAKAAQLEVISGTAALPLGSSIS